MSFKEQKFGDGAEVKISSHADFKYNNRRSGANGLINDVYYSEKYDEYVYEIEFSNGFELIHEADLEAFL